MSMLKQKSDLRRILCPVLLLLDILIVVASVGGANGPVYTTYYASDYNVLDGTYFAGSVPASVQTVDSDYFIAQSSPSATSASIHNPSAFNLWGDTAYVSGSTGDLVSDNGNYMLYRSYPGATSAQTLYAHQETVTIGGSAYYLQKPESSEAIGTSLSTSMAATGRQLLGRFVYPLMGIDSMPASAWTNFYRAWRDPDPIIAYDSSGSGNNGDGASSMTWTHVVGSGTNRFMAIGISIRTVTVSVLNVTVGGQLAIFLRSDIRDPSIRGEIWYLVNPNPGSKTVTVTLSAASKASGGSVSYTGVEQTNPIVNHQGMSYGGVTPSLPLTTTVDNAWIFSNLAISGTGTAAVHGSGQVHRYYQVGTGGGPGSRAGVDGDDKPTTIAGSYAMSWNMSFWSDVVAQAVAFKPAPIPFGHVDVDILIRQSNGTARTTVATNVANSGDLTSTASTLSGTHSWSAYTTVNQTDYLEIDYYIDVTTATPGTAAYLRIDDSTLPAVDQTRVANIMLPSEYTVEVEFTGDSNVYSWTQVEWAMDSAWTTDAVAITLQLYDYTLSGYPTSGNGFISYTSNSTANTDETKTQIITTDPQHFRDAAGNWKIKVKAVKSTTSQFDLKADWVQFQPVYYSQYMVSTEFVFLSMIATSPAQLNFTLVSQYDIVGVDVTVQVWNYSSSTYATSGQGFLKYTGIGTNETRSLNIETDPQFYVSDGNAKIKVIGTLTAPTQFQQEINQVQLIYGYDVHDVAIIGVTASTAEATQGQTVNISVLVENNGTKPETFDVTLFRNETAVETKSVTDLMPGNQITLEFAWNTTGVTEAAYRMRAVASMVLGETDTADNEYAGSIIKVNTRASFQPFDWLSVFSYALPVVFGVPLLLFFFIWKRQRDKKIKPYIAKTTEAFSQQFGMTHQQMEGKKMLLEIDPTSDYHNLLSSFASEAKANGELLFILTNKNSTLHSTFSEAGNVKFLLLTSKTSTPRQVSSVETLLPASDLSILLDACVRLQRVETQKNLNLLFDNLSDTILRCGFEKTYKFTSFLLEAISQAKMTAIFVFNPTAHDRVVASSMRGLFKNKLAYATGGPKVGTL